MLETAGVVEVVEVEEVMEVVEGGGHDGGGGDGGGGGVPGDAVLADDHHWAVVSPLAPPLHHVHQLDQGVGGGGHLVVV